MFVALTSRDVSVVINISLEKCRQAVSPVSSGNDALLINDVDYNCDFVTFVVNNNNQLYDKKGEGCLFAIK